jgi:hypothetical protein
LIPCRSPAISGSTTIERLPCSSPFDSAGIDEGYQRVRRAH